MAAPKAQTGWSEIFLTTPSAPFIRMPSAILIDGASTPPWEGGDYETWVKHVMTCGQCEERMSDYLENVLSIPERTSVELHFQSCRVCSDLLAGMKIVANLGKTFPVHAAPAWLPARIIANTPVIARESWFDTLRSIGRWIVEPRTAMAIFTATLVLAWMGSIAGISPNWGAIARDPSTIYYQAVRACYRSPLAVRIQSEIEQFMEIS